MYVRFEIDAEEKCEVMPTLTRNKYIKKQIKDKDNNKNKET
jgi:hypothetical protein